MDIFSISIKHNSVVIEKTIYLFYILFYIYFYSIFILYFLYQISSIFFISSFSMIS